MMCWGYAGTDGPSCTLSSCTLNRYLRQAPGIDRALHDFSGVPYGQFQRSPFNAFVYHSNQLRSIALAAKAAAAASTGGAVPTRVLRPWPGYKSFTAKMSV